MKNFTIRFGFLLISFLFAVGQVNAADTLLGDTDNNNKLEYNYEPQEVDIQPTAVLRISNDSGNLDKYSGTTATTFTFDGNSSYDPETTGSKLETRFDFDNDGKLDTYFSKTKRVTHKYETTGIKTVRMEVLDLAGNVATTYAHVVVVQNTPPDAYFAITPRVGTPGTVFTLDSSISSDSQYTDRLLEYRYDFNGDGRWDTKFTKLKTIKHNFQTSGIKNVLIEVRDPEKSSAYYTQLIYIKDNKPPIAELRVKSIKNGSVQIDASSSYDPDGSKLKYRLDFDNNGLNDIQYDTSWVYSPFSTHNYKKAGEYLIKLLVKDEDQTISIKIVRIFIDILV